MPTGTGSRETAYVDFATAVSPGLLRSALLLCSDWHLAEDLVQTTLGKVYVGWRKVSVADSPVAYAHGILTKTFLSQARKRSSSESPGLRLRDVAEAGPDLATRLTLVEALDTLDALDRAVIVLRYWEDRSIAETAAATRLSPAAVKMRSHRSLRSLRAHLSMEEAS